MFFIQPGFKSEIMQNGKFSLTDTLNELKHIKKL